MFRLSLVICLIAAAAFAEPARVNISESIEILGVNRNFIIEPMDDDSAGLCADFRFPSEGIFTSCSDQEMTVYIACCDSSAGAGDTIKITSNDSTVEYFDSTTMTWEPVVALDPTPWGTYWVHLDTDSCDWVWSEYPATGSHGDWFQILVNSGCTNIDTAFIRIQVDNKGTLFGNGTYIDTTHGNPGSGSTGWRQLFEFDLTAYFHGVVDTLEIMGYNSGGMAGILFELYVICGGCCGNIDPYSIDFAVNGNIYSFGDPSLSWDGDSILTFTPQSPDTFEDGDTVFAELLYAADSCDWVFDTSIFTVDLEFFVDLSPPTFRLIYPLPGDLTSLPDSFVFMVWDSFSGLDTLSISANAAGAWFSVGDFGSEYRDTALVFSSADVGLVWSPGDSIIIYLAAMDSPDLCSPNADSVRFVWFMRDPNAPVPSIVEPSPWIYSACVPESIVIEILDPHGIEESTIQLDINGNIYDLTATELSWNEPYLNYYSTSGWPGEDTITIELLHARDIFSNDISAPLAWSFIVDYNPPTATLTEPAVYMVRDIQQDISIDVCDFLSGPNSSTAVLTIDGIAYTGGQLSWQAHGDCATVFFRPEDTGLTFINGDTVHVCIEISDSPDRCAPNLAEYCWDFTIEPTVGCEVVPNPFTPNGDETNDRALFFYPNMFSEAADIIIFDSKNHEIWRSEVAAQTDITSAPGRLWNGEDSSGEPATPGLYLYIVNSGGRVICNGTLLLLR